MEKPFVQPSDEQIEHVNYPSLKNKIVLITGASSGIGAAAAVCFAKSGSKLALHGRCVDRLQQVETLCIESGAKKDEILTVHGDITTNEGVETFVNESVSKFGAIDILVSNAGYGILKDFQHSPVEVLDEMYKANPRSCYHLCQMCLPFLKKSKGNIIVTSSVAGLTVAPFLNDYCLSKAMLQMMVKNLALELAPYKVRVNSVNPGVVRTRTFSRRGLVDSNGTAEIKEQSEEKMFANFATRHPLGRVGWPEEVAQSILFLASDCASFITGNSIVIDGGYVLTTSMNFPPKQ